MQAKKMLGGGGVLSSALRAKLIFDGEVDPIWAKKHWLGGGR